MLLPCRPRAAGRRAALPRRVANRSLFDIVYQTLGNGIASRTPEADREGCRPSGAAGLRPAGHGVDPQESHRLENLPRGFPGLPHFAL